MRVEPDKIKSIFVNAVELGTLDQRVAYLDDACEGDAELRGRVEQLLHAHYGKDSLFDEGSFGIGPILDSPIAEGPGTVIGPYKLHEQIGAGGFGVVYLAEQQEPVRRRVALKIIKPGMDSKEVIARF